MTTPAAGWYPDPAGSGGMRWWDGVAWGDQVQPAPQPVAQPGAAPGEPWHVAHQGNAAQAPGQQWNAGQPWNAGAPPQQQWTGQPAQQAPATFAQRNKNSLIVAAIAIIYVVLAAAAHIVILGFLPVLFAVLELV